MAGINLSQSMMGTPEHKAKKNFSDAGFALAALLFILVAAVWGGLRFYISSLDKKIVALDGEMAGYTEQLRGDEVNRVADLDARVTFLGENVSENTDPQIVFSQLESLIVPSIVLTQYEYNKTEKVATIVGRTDNYRYLAEQILSLKSEQAFSDVKVSSIGRNKDGGIIFTLKVHF